MTRYEELRLIAGAARKNEIDNNAFVSRLTGNLDEALDYWKTTQETADWHYANLEIMRGIVFSLHAENPCSNPDCPILLCVGENGELPPSAKALLAAHDKSNADSFLSACESIDLRNIFRVQHAPLKPISEKIFIGAAGSLPFGISAEEALILAAWLAKIAGPLSTVAFGDIMDEVETISEKGHAVFTERHRAGEVK